MNIFSIFDFKSCLNDVDERYRQFDPKVGPFKLKFLSKEQIKFFKQGFKLYSETYKNVQHYIDRVAIDHFEKKKAELIKATHSESPEQLAELKKLIAEYAELFKSPAIQTANTIANDLPKYAQISASLLEDATWEKFPEEIKVHKVEWLKYGKFAHYSTAALLDAFNCLEIIEGCFKEARKEVRVKTKEFPIQKVGPLIDQINPFFIPEAFLEKYRSHLEAQLSLVTKEKETLILAMLNRLKFMSDNKKQSHQFKLPDEDVLSDLIGKVKGFINEGPWTALPEQSFFSIISHEDFYQAHYRILKHLDILSKNKNDSFVEIKDSFEVLFWIAGNDTCQIQLVRKKKAVILVPKSHAFLAGDIDSWSYKGPHIADFALYQIQNENLNESLQNEQYEKASRLIQHISAFLIQQKQNAKNPKIPLPSVNKKKFVEVWQRIFLEMAEKLIDKTAILTDNCLKDLLTHQLHDLALYQFVKSLKLLAFAFEKSAPQDSPIVRLLLSIRSTEKKLLHKDYINKVEHTANAYFYYFDKVNLIISSSLQPSIDKILLMKNAQYPQALHELEEVIRNLWPEKGPGIILLRRLLTVQLKACLKPNKDLFTLARTFEMQHAFHEVKMMHQWINNNTSKLHDLLEKFLNLHLYPLEELKEDYEILHLCENYLPGNLKAVNQNIMKYIDDLNLEDLERIKETNNAKKKLLENKLNQNQQNPNLDDMHQVLNFQDFSKNCAHLLLLLNDESLILAYGNKCLTYYKNKDFLKLHQDVELVKLCFLCPDLKNTLSERLLAFCLLNIKNITHYFPDWAELDDYFTDEDSSKFSKAFSAVLFDKIDQQFSSTKDLNYLKKFLSFKFTLTAEDRSTLQTKLEEIIQNDWTLRLGIALEYLNKYLDLKSLQSYRLKWFKGMISNINPVIPHVYSPKSRGFDELYNFYGIDQLSQVFENIKELYKQPELSLDIYTLLQNYLDTQADSPELAEESPLIQKLYSDYCTLADEINESLASQISVIGEVMNMIELENYKDAIEKIGQHCRQLPSSHVTIHTQHQLRAKQVMDLLYEKIENWLIKKIRNKSFNIKAFKEAFTLQKTPRLELLCTQTDAIANLGVCVEKFADSYESQMAGDMHLALNKYFAYPSELSQWYVFLINNKLFSLLNCQTYEDKNLLKETLQKIFMRTHDPLLKKACMLLMPFLRNPYRTNDDLSLKNEEIAFQQILCKMFLRDSIDCMGNLDNPIINPELRLDLLRICKTFSKDPLYQESLPELKVLTWLNQLAEGKGLTISTEDLNAELQKFKHDSFAFPISSSYHKWDAILKSIFTLHPESEMSIRITNSVLGERYLHPGIQKQLFDENNKLIEDAKVRGEFKHTVASVMINDKHVYFKFSPRGLGIQTMVSTLERILFGEGLPIGLMGFPAGIAGQKQPFAVQLSLGVEGKTVAKIWNKRQSFKVDLKNFSQNFIRILFDRELDGQPANYIASLRQNSQFYFLSVIDSEQGFGRLEGQNSLQIVSLILCLDEMKQSLHPEVVQHILSLDPYEVISQFITDIELQTRQYLNLFDQKVRQKQFNQEEMAVLQPPLTREMVRDIFITFCQLQDILKHNDKISHLELLQQIHPKVVPSYEHLLHEKMHPLERFEQVSREQKRHIIVDEGDERFYISSLSNRTLYKSIADAMPKSEVELQKLLINPKEALRYLNELNKQYEELESIQKDLLNDNEERFLNLEDNFLKEAVINGIEGRFKGISFQAISQEKQEKILSFMEGMTFRCLRLKGCSETLTPKKLKSLLGSSPNLQILDIAGCKKIDDETFQAVTILVKKIEVLILDDTNLIFVGSHNFLRHLQYLSVRNCHHLKNLMIISPALKKVYFDDYNYSNLIIQRFQEKQNFGETLADVLVIPKLISNFIDIKIKKVKGVYPADYQELKKSKKVTNLTISRELHLENLEEGVDKIKEILLQHQNTIKLIDFDNVNLTPEQIEDLLQMSPHLRAIELAGPQISNQIVKAVIDNTKILALILKDCPEVSKEYVIQLVNQSKHLSVFYFK